jgi:hypothetical protein
MLARCLFSLMGTGCLIWTMMWGAASGAYAATIADAVPESASVVVRWKSPQASVGKLADFIDAVQPGFGIFARSYLPSAGQWVGIPGFEGVDLDQDFLAVIFVEPQVSPTVVFVLTAKDVDAIKQELSSDYEVYVSGNLLAYSTDEDSLEEIKERLENKGTSLWSSVDPASTKTFNDADLSVVVNVKQLATDFADEIKAAGPQLDAIIDQITNAMPEDQQQKIGAALDVYRHIGKSLLAAVHDTKSFVLGITVNKDAIRYEDRLQIAEGTPTAQFLAGQPMGDLSLINKLPANKSLYLGSNFDASSMTEWSMKMAKHMAGNLSSEQSEELDAIYKEMRALKFGEVGIYLDLADKSPALRAGTVTTVTPANRMREISSVMLKVLGKIELPNLKQSTTVESNVAKVAGFEVDRITVKQEIEGAPDPFGFQKIFQAVLFGDDGIQQLVTYPTDRMIQTTGGGTAELQTLIDSLAANPESGSAVATTRRRFGEKANFVALLDLARFTVNGLKAAGNETSLPFSTKSLDNVTLSPSFVGFSLSCEPTATRFQIELPLSQFQNILKIVSAIQPQR